MTARNNVNGVVGGGLMTVDYVEDMRDFDELPLAIRQTFWNRVNDLAAQPVLRDWAILRLQGWSSQSVAQAIETMFVGLDRAATAATYPPTNGVRHPQA